MNKPSENKQPPPPASKLTPQQQMALATDKNISVTAGAGSGKTTILVERYLKIIVEEGVGVRQVLAITFTDKAAAEMTERLSRMIVEQLAVETRPARRSRLLELRERLSSAQISTIHSFCSKLLREFAVASGVDPDYAVVSDFQQDLMVQDAIEAVMSALDTATLDSEYSTDDWRELLRQVPPYTLTQIFNAALGNAYEMQILQQRFSEQPADQILLNELVELFFSELDKVLDRRQVIADLLPFAEHLNSVPVDRDALKPKGRALFETADKLAGLAITAPDNTLLWDYLLQLALLATTNGAAYRSLTGIGKKADLGEAYQAIFALSEAIEPLAQFATHKFSSAPADLDLLHIQALRKVLFLCREVAREYRRLKEERGVLDFDDLQLLTLNMLREHESVRNSLRNRYRYIMVDEFQDTNQLQWDIISLMGMLDGELQPRKFFIVGDPKQSIYGFRNADVRVFHNVTQAFIEDRAEDARGDVVLRESFRFLPSLNGFVNQLFRKVLGSDPDNDFDVQYDDLDTRRTSADNSHIELSLVEQDTLKELQLTLEDQIAQTIRRLLDEEQQVYHRAKDGETLQPLNPGDIAILIPRRTHLLDLESKLREYSIPFKTIGGVGFYRRQEVFDVYHLLRFLDNPADDLALVALLRSPFAGISDAALFTLSEEKGQSWRQKLENVIIYEPYPEGEDADFSPLDAAQLLRFRDQLRRWEKRRDRLSLSKLLNEIFEESFYRATVAAEWNGDQLLANLDKIIEMARDYEAGGFMALADFIESLHQIITLDPREGEAQIALEDESTVKIMTIHQSKGLEFPVIISPYLQQNPRPDGRKIRFDADNGLAFKIRNPKQQYQEEKPFLFQWLDHRQKQKQVAEQKRLFYVAVTRARDRVYLIGSLGKKDVEKENNLGWLLRAFELDPENLPAGPFEISDDITIHIRRDIEPQGENAPGREDIAPALADLQHSISTAKAAGVQAPQALLPLKDSPKGVTFSATQLLTFNDSPDDYFRRYHLGFFESDYEFVKQLRDDNNVSLLKGKIVHQILEEWPGSNGKDPRKAIIEKMEQCFFAFEVFDRELQEQLLEEIPQLIENFAKTDFARELYADLKGKAEISLTMKLGTDFFTGTLDRIFFNPEGFWEVVDYKTNKISRAEVNKTGEKYLMQMKSYAVLIAELFPEQGQYPVTLYFLAPGEIYRQIYTPADIAEIKNHFSGLIGKIKQYFPFV